MNLDKLNYHIQEYHNSELPSDYQARLSNMLVIANRLIQSHPELAGHITELLEEVGIINGKDS